MKHKLPIALLLTAFVPGCFFVEDDDDSAPAPVVTGFADLDWTISGVADPDQCDLAGVDSIDITLTTTRGDFVDDIREPCEAFFTSIELFPDRYFLDAVLLDIDGFERTTVVRPAAFDIFGDDSLSLSVDFPPSSFF